MLLFVFQPGNEVRYHCVNPPPRTDEVATALQMRAMAG